MQVTLDVLVAFAFVSPMNLGILCMWGSGALEGFPSTCLSDKEQPETMAWYYM